ncbi:phosphotransferase [Nonomuraea sp. NPDC059194]|uniref:phosphotransferase n=1 Tax=Nonomuraea sp. NPDC059194 TaxID=3346764 RepID=UPI003693C477
MQPGPLIGSGRTADVFAVDDAWVLRRYRDGRDASAEAAVMSHVFRHGYPVPRVDPGANGDYGYPVPRVYPGANGDHGRAASGADLSANGDLGCAASGVGPRANGDLLVERLSGPTMAEALQDGVITSGEAGEALAGLLHRLHALPPLDATGPAGSVLHLDLHPENVLLTPRGPVVIDWADARQGPPALDWGMSVLILAEVAVGPRVEAPVARAVLASLLGAAASQVVDLDGALAIRSANPTLGRREGAPCRSRSAGARSASAHRIP